MTVSHGHCALFSSRSACITSSIKPGCSKYIERIWISSVSSYYVHQRLVRFFFLAPSLTDRYFAFLHAFGYVQLLTKVSEHLQTSFTDISRVLHETFWNFVNAIMKSDHRDYISKVWNQFEHTYTKVTKYPMQGLYW